MKTIDTSIHIDQPLENVFAFVCESRNLPRWQPETYSSRHTPPGPLQLGTRIDNEARNAGVSLKSTSIVRDFCVDDKIAFELVTANSSIVADLIWSVKPDHTGTRFRVQADYQLSGLMTLVAPFLKPLAQKTIDRHLHNLKSVLETGYQA